LLRTPGAPLPSFSRKHCTSHTSHGTKPAVRTYVGRFGQSAATAHAGRGDTAGAKRSHRVRKRGGFTACHSPRRRRAVLRSFWAKRAGGGSGASMRQPVVVESTVSRSRSSNCTALQVMDRSISSRGEGRSEIADGTGEGEGCGAAYGKCLAERLGAPEEHIAHTKCCEALLRVVCKKMCPQRIRSNARAERRVQPHDVFNFRHGRIWRLCLLTATSSCLLDRSPQLHARESCSATTRQRIAGWEVASTCFVAARSCSPDMDLGPPARTGLAAEGKPAAPCCGQEGRRNFHKLSIRNRKLPAPIAELDGRGRH